MADLSTSFAGLKLANPIIISSSGLTKTAANNARLEEAGAAAVVIKSLFEEQIQYEAGQMLESNTYEHTEALDYLGAYVSQHKLAEYLDVIRESRKACSIPVIASINCHNDAEWVNFAREIEYAGASALEVNILSLQTQAQYEYGAFEKEHVKILKHLKQTISIPVIMKLGSNFTNPVALVNELKAAGADAVVLFNRFYPFDIDTDTMKVSSGQVLSNGSELSQSLRWAGIVSNAVGKMDIAVSGGVHDGAGIAKSLLVGANAVELCSVVFEKGLSCIAQLKAELSAWMDKKGYASIDQFKGSLNSGSGRSDADLFERTQFIKHFGGKE
ncbi:MAG: dihydroorotate dehydrogenase-like protein [Bacteroidales bacterium]|nr:dihydroorotate dehydrogenase-like protein [Bacteroidales bacterium]